MTQELIDKLKEITEEERQILNGNKQIDKGLYQSDEDTNRIDAKKLLDAGKLITLRPHTRFIHFPAHTHNYVEVIYMCTGTTHHIVNGNEIELKQGELLFLNQNCVQEILPAGENDIAVNFIILPEFFDYSLRLMETEENLLRSFMIDCLTATNEEATYLHFKVADFLPVQNLVENLIWTLLNHQPNKRSINQITMGLLMLQLLDHVDAVETDKKNKSQILAMNVLSYVDEHYRNGELADLAAQLHYDFYWLSREIKRCTGATYTELVQSRRMSQACYLLTHTAMSVSDVGSAVGYENASFFHKAFLKRYGTTPRKYRMQNREAWLEKNKKTGGL